MHVEELVVKGPTWLPDEKTKKEIEDGLERWREARKGTQIASVSATVSVRWAPS